MMKGICLFQEVRLGDADALYTEILEEQKNDLEINKYTMNMLETFAYNLQRYEDLVNYIAPLSKQQPKDQQLKSWMLIFSLKSMDFKAVYP